MTLHIPYFVLQRYILSSGRQNIFYNSLIAWFKTFNYLETYGMWHFCPRPCRWWEGAGSDHAFSSPNENKAGGGKGTKTFAPLWVRRRETSPQSQSPLPHLVWFTLISSVCAPFSACSQRFPDAALSGWPRASGKRGKVEGFPGKICCEMLSELKICGP